jgi:histidinol-phosphate/aromatic aminotransferase/cobyric acid decarboxylase-like protein
VVVLRSMTKDYALTALRLGYAVAGEPVITRLSALQPDWSVNGLAQAAGVVALADDGYLERARAAVQASRECIEERFGAMGIRCYPTSANYVLAQVGDAAALRDALVRRGMFVRDCASFGLPDCVRIGLRPVADCQRLAGALAEVREDTGDR